jgi:hypothetical protein
MGNRQNLPHSQLTETKPKQQNQPPSEKVVSHFYRKKFARPQRGAAITNTGCEFTVTLQTGVELQCSIFDMKTAIIASLCLGTFAQALEVHEWGTFTVLSGSNGYHVPWYASASDLASLPDFVSRSSSFKAGVSTIRMETPVIYFYPEKEMNVSVEVSFSGGNVTETFPHASGGGRSIWTGRLHPPTDKDALKEIPAITESAHPEPYGAAREVPDAWIFESDLKEIPGLKVQPHFPQMEKFIFYRGAGNGHIPITAQIEGDVATITNGAEEAIPFAVALRVRGGKAAWIAIPLVAGRPSANEPAMNQAKVTLPKAERPIDEVESELADEWKKALAKDGLTPAEASAMVETWRKTWFRESGDRILTLVPRKVTDGMLPLKITPIPEELERVFVARIEMVSPEREQKLVGLMNSPKIPNEAEFVEFESLELGRFSNGAMEIATQIQARRMQGKFYGLKQFGESRKR